MGKNVFISVLQTIGIILVVAGHSMSREIELNEWIYSFHMPLFMFMSGLLLRYTDERKQIRLRDNILYGRKGFIWKKVKRLLIPYVAISTLAFFPKALLSSFALRPVDLSVAGFLHQLVYPWDNVIIYFWFLPTLFLIFMIVIYGAKLCGFFTMTWHFHVTIFFILLCLHIYNPLAKVRLLNLGGVADYFVYFAAGYYYCKLHIKMPQGWRLWLMLFITLIVSISMVIYVHDFKGKDIVAAFSGIMFCMLLAQVYVNANVHFLDHLFGASYIIYLFSWFPQTACRQVLLGMTNVPVWFSGVLALLFGIYVPLLIFRLMVRYKETKLGKVVAFLTGQ